MAGYWVLGENVTISVIKWAALALLGLVATLANVLLSPIIALFICGDGYLPRWLGWFQTPDNPAIGDKAFQLNQMPWTLRLPDWLARYFLGIGWVLRRFICQGKHYFQFTALYHWNTSRAWRISFGWTLSIWDIRSGNRCRINTTINPWMDCR